MIKCKICNYESKFRLIEHILKKHQDITIEYYKENYGEVVSEEYKKRCSEIAQNNWKNKEYRDNVIKSREYIYNDEEIQNKRINSIKKYYYDGGKVWNEGLTKENDIRIKESGEKIKKCLFGRTKENYEYLQKHSEFMKLRWKYSEMYKKWNEIQSNNELKNDWISKISKTISEKIANGEINTHNQYKYGYYINNINEKYWYSSSLEKDTMILFDKYNINWTNKHSIKIEYYVNDKKHYYIPDFFISINNDNYIIEMKGYDWDKLTELKKEETIKIYKNYFIFYNIDNLEKFIIEKLNN